MSENCNGDCSNCSENCESRTIQKLDPEVGSSFKKTIAIISGKGGVGKSMVTSLLAAALINKGNTVAVLDADVTGPSIPNSFGLKGQMATSNETVLFPVKTKKGGLIMSANLLLQNPEEPLIWRGPMIAGLVEQLYKDVHYGKCDYLLIDMPPGTGDVPLTVFQKINVDGIIVVTSPQDLVSMVVTKSLNMANAMNIPVYGIVENMAYILCPDCGKKIHIYGNENKVNEVASKNNLELLAQIPLSQDLAKHLDNGTIEDYQNDIFDKFINNLK